VSTSKVSDWIVDPPSNGDNDDENDNAAQFDDNVVVVGLWSSGLSWVLTFWPALGLWTTGRDVSVSVFGAWD